MDTQTIASGLLHDVLEDTKITEKELSQLLSQAYLQGKNDGWEKDFEEWRKRILKDSEVYSR